MSFILYVDSNNGVTVYPEYNSKFSAKKVETRQRVRDGGEFVYKWGEYDALKIGVSFVNSSFRAIVNSWWSSNTNLLWVETGETNVTSVHLINKAQPIDTNIKPHNDLFKGKIELGTY